jgi:tetratricopeptide (TPR) repeat protein
LQGPLAGALLLSLLGLAAGCAREEPSFGEHASRPRSVLFIGLDGADWARLEPLMASGRMPNLARLERQGSGGVLLTEQPPLSPLLWTTMMTGRSPLEHRVLDFVRFHPASGRREPITSEERAVPAVWNLASEAGREVAVFGLWATWPAEEVQGLLVSDRFVSASTPVPRAVAPVSQGSWAEGVRARARESVDLAAMRRLLPDLSAAELASALSSSDPFAAPLSGLRQVLVQTEVVRALSTGWLRDHPTRLAIVYFEGTDTIGHLFAPFEPPPLSGLDPSEASRYAGVAERYYELVDGVIGELAALAARSETVLMIASDHGFHWGEGRPAEISSVASATAAKWHREPGIYLLAGPGIPSLPGHRGRGAVAQVAATLLALVDLPAREGMAPALAETGPAPGLALPQAPFRRAPSAPGGAGSDPSQAAAEEEGELQKLRALGYLGGELTRPGGSRPHGTRTVGSFSNEAQILELAGRLQEAVRAYEQGIEQEPEDASAKWNLSNLLFENDREPAKSDRLLVEALARGLPKAPQLVVARAAACRESGRADRAVALLDAAVEQAPASVELRLFRGRSRIELGDCAGAKRDFSAAVRLDAGRAGSWAALATAELCLGSREAARRDFERALELAPEREELRRALAGLRGPEQAPSPR